jgi:hypothetical protein
MERFGDSVETYERVKGPIATMKPPVVNIRSMNSGTNWGIVYRRENVPSETADITMSRCLSTLSLRLPQTHSARNIPSDMVAARALQPRTPTPSDFTYNGITGPVRVADEATP